MVYHSSAYLDLVQRGVIELGDPCDVCVPTGNFGNVLAAVYARAMGLPFRHFTVAANQNNVLADFIQSGSYDLRDRALSKTISPSIDILTSSNLERMLHLLCQQAGVDPGPEVARCFGALRTEREHSCHMMGRTAAHLPSCPHSPWLDLDWGGGGAQAICSQLVGCFEAHLSCGWVVCR